MSSFILMAFIIKIDSKGPLFFIQKRIETNKTSFCILKFRKIRSDALKETPIHLLAEPERFTTMFSKILRKTVIDELPQLINIF